MSVILLLLLLLLLLPRTMAFILPWNVLTPTWVFLSSPLDLMENMNMLTRISSYPTTVAARSRDTNPASRRHVLGSIVKLTCNGKNRPAKTQQQRTTACRQVSLPNSSEDI